MIQHSHSVVCSDTRTTAAELTSAASNILLNFMLAFTFTVMSVLPGETIRLLQT